jgi:hypothetical protein
VSEGKRIRWTIATARQNLPTLIAMVAREPQDVYRRDTLVARVVSPDRVPQSRPPLAEAVAELQRICAEERYTFPPVRRSTRPDPLAKRPRRRKRRP